MWNAMETRIRQLASHSAALVLEFIAIRDILDPLIY